MSLAAYSDMHPDFSRIAGPARAAILLLAMGANSASRLLKHLSPSEIRALKASVADRDPVSAEQVETLVSQFQEEFKTGSGLSGLDGEMTKLLRSTLSSNEYTDVFGADDLVDPSLFLGPSKTVWEEMEQLGLKGLTTLLAPEHPQVVAITIARLPAEISAALLASFDPVFRNDVMRRLLSAKPFAAKAESLIQTTLRDIFVAGSDDAEKSSRRATLAEIVNRLEKSQTDDFLASIEEMQPEEAVAIRSLLFAFEDLPELQKKARLVLFDEVPTETVTCALRGAPPELVEIVVSSLAARARRMVEAELGQAVDVSAKDIIAARRTIASLALQLAGEGRIVIGAAKEA